MKIVRKNPLCPIAHSFDQQRWTPLSGQDTSNLFSELVRILNPGDLNIVIDKIESGLTAKVEGPCPCMYLRAVREQQLLSRSRWWEDERYRDRTVRGAAPGRVS